MGSLNGKVVWKPLFLVIICGILLHSNGFPITCDETNCTKIDIGNSTSDFDNFTEVIQTPLDLARADVDTVQNLVGEGQIERVQDLLEKDVVITEWPVENGTSSVPPPLYFGVDETTQNSTGKRITTTQNVVVETVTTNPKMLVANTATMQTLIRETAATLQNPALESKTTIQNWLESPGEAYTTEKIKLTSMTEYKLPAELPTITSTTKNVDHFDSATPFIMPRMLNQTSLNHKSVDATNSNEADSLSHKVFPRKPEDNVSPKPTDPLDPVTGSDEFEFNILPDQEAESNDSGSNASPDAAAASTSAPSTSNYAIPISSSEEMVRDPAPRESLPADNFYKKTAYYSHVSNADVARLCPAAADCADTSSLMDFLVCGSNGVVYRNIGVFSCAQLCSIGLHFNHYGPCEGAKTVPPPTYLPPTSSKRPIQKTFIPRMKEYLRKRIRAKLRHPRYKHDLYKSYCDANPGVCPFHHSMYNATLFLIDVQPYEAEYT